MDLGCAVILLFIAGFYRVQNQWIKDHPAKKEKAAPIMDPRDTIKTDEPQPKEVHKKPSQIKQPDTISKPSDKPTKQDEQKVSIRTLKDLFNADFSHTMKFSKEIVLGPSKENTLTIYTNVYLDFDSKSEFVGFFIPSSPLSFAVCNILANTDWNKQISNLKPDVIVEGGMIGDSAQTSTKELSFTHRVYIYHEDRLSLQQLASLEQAFKSHGLSVIFRGTDYLGLKIIDSHRNK